MVVKDSNERDKDPSLFCRPEYMDLELLSHMIHSESPVCGLKIFVDTNHLRKKFFVFLKKLVYDTDT